MRLSKAILVAVLSFAFAAYGFDCSPVMSPDKAMECCDSMNCSHGMHGEDCCQMAPSIHAPFMQPASVHSAGFVPLALAVQPISSQIRFFDPADGRATLRFHDPPLIFDSSAPLQLRI
jgi:hypothetical protein